MSNSIETIAALATPAGRSGVGIIRVSGPLVTRVAQFVLKTIPEPRYAHYGPFHDAENNVIDIGIALYFPGPHSFTGEDVLELQAHGGPVLLDLVMKSVCLTGVRLARPGEFSERAFLNDKLDLAQAEAIADLIDASTEAAARAAVRSLQGEFSQEILRLIEAVTQLRIYVEAAIDFPEEEIDFLIAGQVEEKLTQQKCILKTILLRAQQGSVLKEGIHIVLAGRPNAGKSSLLNRLSGRESAIVTPIAGTTRDLVREEISLDGLPVHIIDTAGLHASNDLVEQEGMKRTWQAIEKADCIVMLVDDEKGWQKEDDEILRELPEKIPKIVVHTKIDLTNAQAGSIQKEPFVQINLSSKTGTGITELTDYLKVLVGYSGAASGMFLARRRHIIAIEQAQHAVEAALKLLKSGRGDLIAEELRQAQLRLGEITGAVSSDELLGKIFASFCIGK